MRVFVLVDNEYLYVRFREMVRVGYDECDFDYYYSYNNKEFLTKYIGCHDFCAIDLREVDIKKKLYDVFLSLHSKQIFPLEMVQNYKCINVHPGFNPYNRGWFPQVFSIINKKPIGVTIHEMDGEIDHGPIICQECVTCMEWETSYEVYNKIQELEVRLLQKWLKRILTGNYTTTRMEAEGNINTKRDFRELCKLDMQQIGTFQQFYDLLRATTHGDYSNAFFYDAEGRKVYISLKIKVE